MNVKDLRVGTKFVLPVNAGWTSVWDEYTGEFDVVKVSTVNGFEAEGFPARVVKFDHHAAFSTLTLWTKLGHWTVLAPALAEVEVLPPNTLIALSGL